MFWRSLLGASPALLVLVTQACGGDDDGGEGSPSSTSTGGSDPTGSGGSQSTSSGGSSTTAGGSANEAGGGGMAGGGGEAGGPLEAGGRVIEMTAARFFPEGVTVDKSGTFYLGSMELGTIEKATANSSEALPFIAPDDENQLVSVIGLYADDASNLLYVCSSDAGNSSRAGEAPAAIKAFSLPDGEFVASYEWPEYSGEQLDETITGGVTGFCNDMTMDAEGNLYATDSWYPRILRLPVGGNELEEWVVSEVFPQDQWHLNGIDIDQSNDTLYVVENHPGALYAIPIQDDGSPGEVSELDSSRELLSPDGLKVLARDLLVTAEGANDGGGVSVLRVDGSDVEVEEVISGFNQLATLALHQASAWVVENQGDHFWGPTENGPDADPPFRLVEVPLTVGAGAGTILTNEERFFPEGVTRDADDNFYIGSMETGKIHRVSANAGVSEDFIEPNEDNGLVSVLGLHASGTTLWACSSDAGNGQRAGAAPAALKAFDLQSGDLLGSWDWPEFSGELLDEELTGGVTGFCNDITVDSEGNVYATDSWYPRVLRLAAGAGENDALEEWVVSDVFPQNQWHLNGIDIDAANNRIYVVENHPGALYAIEVRPNGSAGSVTEIETSRPLLSPDGLKLVGDGLLAVAEGQSGGMALIELNGDTGVVRRLSTGLDGIATFAVRDGSAWLVENQGDHFWGSATDPLKPFRLVEVPLGIE
ncbi:MAG TPA: SMP-30/gluconolactonase/LRE family protein [Polyangiaceae bacterium]